MERFFRYADFQRYSLPLHLKTSIRMAYEKKIPVDLDCPLQAHDEPYRIEMEVVYT